MTQPNDYFINPCCFGDDVAKWLIRELRRQGMEIDEEPGQEDFGWYLNFETAGVAHTFVIGHRQTGATEEGTWIGWLERKARPDRFHTRRAWERNSDLGSTSNSTNLNWVSGHSRCALAFPTRLRQRN